jgi:carboxymethylenebutenolidase
VTTETQTPLNDLDRFERYLVDEFYDDYVEGEISRRTFVRRLFYITGSMAAVGPIMLALGCAPGDVPDPKSAVPSPEVKATTPPATPTGTVVPVPDAKSPLSVPEFDPRVRGEMVRFANGADQISGYLARPASGPTTGLKGVLICHENAGYSPHFGDIARRFATQGYVAIALDLLSREGGTDKIQRDQVSGTLTGAGIARHVSDFDAARKYLGTLPGVDGTRIGMIGFCFGGGVTWEAATKIPELKAVAPFYGPAPDLANVPNIKAAAFGVYAENDARITGASPALAEALTKANVKHQMKTYPGMAHGFFNDTRTYNETIDAQAQTAWRDTLAWFTANL